MTAWWNECKPCGKSAKNIFITGVGADENSAQRLSLVGQSCRKRPTVTGGTQQAHTAD